jgi:hypothetical protein
MQICCVSGPINIQEHLPNVIGHQWLFKLRTEAGFRLLT